MAMFCVLEFLYCFPKIECTTFSIKDKFYVKAFVSKCCSISKIIKILTYGAVISGSVQSMDEFTLLSSAMAGVATENLVSDDANTKRQNIS